MKVNLEKNDDHYFLSITDYQNEEREEIAAEVRKEMKKCPSKGKHICCPECGSYIVHNGFKSPYLRDSSIVLDNGKLICNSCIGSKASSIKNAIKIDMNDPDFDNYIPVEIVDLRILPPSGNMLNCNCS